MRRAILLMVFGLLSPLSCFAQQSVVGTYKLVSYVTIIDGEIREALGKDPRGYLVLTRTRCFVLMTAESQNISQSAAVKAALWDSIVSYSGPYRFEGNKMIISNEASSSDIGNGINYSQLGDKRTSTGNDNGAFTVFARCIKNRHCPRQMGEARLGCSCGKVKLTISLSPS